MPKSASSSGQGASVCVKALFTAIHQYAFLKISSVPIICAYCIVVRAFIFYRFLLQRPKVLKFVLGKL